MRKLDKPLVSIITPCYNGEDYLERYFASILAQTYGPLELIFINDGSTDGTGRIAESYRAALEEKGIRFIYLEQENAGQAAAVNRGLKLFTGEYLTWPDADDEMTPDCIEKKVTYLQAHPELDMCICRGVQVYEEAPTVEAGILQRVFQSEENLFDDLIFLRNVFYVPGGYMVRASAVDACITGREIFTGRGGQNVQLLLPVSYRHRYGYMDDILFRYFIRSDSHSHSIDTTQKVIEQYERFETLLLETLKRMPDELYVRYAPDIRCHYARIRFGNALDSRDARLIGRFYREMARAGGANVLDWLRYKKYTVPVIRKLFDRKSGE